jgi:hypothetical protein
MIGNYLLKILQDKILFTAKAQRTQRKTENIGENTKSEAKYIGHEFHGLTQKKRKRLSHRLSQINSEKTKV